MLRNYTKLREFFGTWQVLLHQTRAPRRFLHFIYAGEISMANNLVHRTFPVIP